MDSAFEPMLSFNEGQELIFHQFIIITIKNYEYLMIFRLNIWK